MSKHLVQIILFRWWILKMSILYLLSGVMYDGKNCIDRPSVFVQEVTFIQSGRMELEDRHTHPFLMRDSKRDPVFIIHFTCRIGLNKDIGEDDVIGRGQAVGFERRRKQRLLLRRPYGAPP
jgi:hypothetical protein